MYIYNKMVKNKMVKNLPPSPNTRSNKMRNMKQLALTQQSLGTTTNNISAASNTQITQIYKGYCNSRRNETLTFGYLSGDFSVTDLTGTVFSYGGIGNANFTGSDLTNATFDGNGCLNLAGVNLTGTSIQGGSGLFCNYLPLKSYITFTKDRTTTCITPLGENESILINRMLTTDNDEWLFGRTSYFNSIDIYKVLELDATGFGLQSNNNNNRVSRFIFTNSLGKITITGSQLISSPTGINSNHIYLDSNNQLNIIKPINDFVYGENPSGFKIRINIKQEATSNIEEGTASVILEYRTVGDTNSAPFPRCNIKDDAGCLNY
jgi:uncharacterized protein YjbI with pentapeptide repeats